MKKAFILLLLLLSVSVYAKDTTQVNEYLVKDASNVYYKTYGGDLEKVEGIKNPKSFEMIGNKLPESKSIYYKDSQNVYCSRYSPYGGEDSYRYVQVITGADAQTFKFKYENKDIEDIYVDKNSVYFGCSKINGSDSSTFGKNKYGTYIDKNNAYVIEGEYEGRVHIGNITGADTATFRQINHKRDDLGEIYKDKDHLFFYSPDSQLPKIVPSSEAKNIKVFVYKNYGHFYYYFTDKNNVYYSYFNDMITWIQQLPGVDAQTMKVIDINIVKDKNNIYYIGSEPDNFQVLKGVDLNTFKLYKTFKLSLESGKGYNGIGRIYKDKDSIYYGGSLDYGATFKKPNKVSGADIKTFEYLSGGYAKDKNNYYFLGDDAYKLEGVDTSSFKVKSDNRAEDKNYYYEGVSKKSK